MIGHRDGVLWLVIVVDLNSGLLDVVDFKGRPDVDVDASISSRFDLIEIDDHHVALDLVTFHVIAGVGLSTTRTIKKQRTFSSNKFN